MRPRRIGLVKPKKGPLKEWAPEGVGPPKRWGAQNFALHNFLSPLSWGSSRGVLVVEEAPGTQMSTCGEPKRAHLRVPAFKNTTKIQREDPKEREE